MPKTTKKRLTRDIQDAWLGGVCAGIASYFDVDVVFVRLIWVLLLIPGGFPGFVPYVVLWILMPVK